MEKWLIEELENKARMEQFDKDRKAHLTVKCIDDLDVPNPLEFRSLLIDQYDGTIDTNVSVQISRLTSSFARLFPGQEEGCQYFGLASTNEYFREDKPPAKY